MDKTLIINRIKEFKKFNSDKELSEFLGITPQSLSTWKSRNSIDYDLIFAKCEGVNLEWLLTGKGEMLNSACVEPVIVVDDKDSDNQPTKQGIPLIPLDAMAGFAIGSEQVVAYSTDRYIVPEFDELKVDFLIRVKGSSMYPKYNSGDIVACKKLALSDIFFQWNKVYVLDTEQGALIKRIRKGSDAEHITLVSDNEKYEPFELEIGQLHAVALVVGVIRLE